VKRPVQRGFSAQYIAEFLVTIGRISQVHCPQNIAALIADSFDRLTPPANAIFRDGNPAGCYPHPLQLWPSVMDAKLKAASNQSLKPCVIPPFHAG